MQSFFIGAGSVIASALPYILTNWFGVSNIAAEGDHTRFCQMVFLQRSGCFPLCSAMDSSKKSREYSPSELAAFKEEQENKR